MIVGTHFGLFMPGLRPDYQRCLAEGEPELQVRSRRKVDLLNLIQLANEHNLPIGGVIQIPRTDYQFRVYCTREVWAQLLGLMALDIDYVKFKDTPKTKHGDTRLTGAYTSMWSTILNAFPTGSVYTQHRRGSDAKAWTPPTPTGRVVETVFHTEKSEWRMNGASPAELRDLMKEIDAATEGVEPATDQEIDVWLNDHSKCTHSDSKTARRRCRSRRMSDS